MPTFFDDEDFQTALVGLICRDSAILKACGHLLTPKDFEPLSNNSEGPPYWRWQMADIGLRYWEKYHEPVGKLLRSEVLARAKLYNIGDRNAKEFAQYARKIQTMKLVGISSIEEKVLAYKREYAKAQAIEELIDLHGSGELTDEKWLELSQRALNIVTGDAFAPTDYFEGLEDRIERRSRSTRNRNPALMIDPLDALVRMIGRGHLGLVLGPYKRGKSLMLIWIALAYVLQHLNVLYVTLEDPQEDVEDRFDAAVTALPLHRLAALPNKLRRRFAKFRRLLRTRLHIIDGTDGGVTTVRIEQFYQQERDQGFIPDAIIVDYDDEVTPSAESARRERRFQFADIYRDLRRIGARHNVIMWTAAQTRRGTEDLKVLSADTLAEDISKVRKATMAISMGRGDWGDESIYLHVAAHKFDTQHVGCNIMSNKSRMLIYDRELTQQMLANADVEQGE